MPPKKQTPKKATAPTSNAGKGDKPITPPHQRELSDDDNEKKTPGTNEMAMSSIMGNSRFDENTLSADDSSLDMARVVLSDEGAGSESSHMFVTPEKKSRRQIEEEERVVGPLMRREREAREKEAKEEREEETKEEREEKTKEQKDRRERRERRLQALKAKKMEKGKRKLDDVDDDEEEEEDEELAQPQPKRRKPTARRRAWGIPGKSRVLPDLTDDSSSSDAPVSNPAPKPTSRPSQPSKTKKQALPQTPANKSTKPRLRRSTRITKVKKSMAESGSSGSGSGSDKESEGYGSAQAKSDDKDAVISDAEAEAEDQDEEMGSDDEELVEKAAGASPAAPASAPRGAPASGWVPPVGKRAKCMGTSLKGVGCRNYAQPPSRYCRFHQPGRSPKGKQWERKTLSMAPRK